MRTPVVAPRFGGEHTVQKTGGFSEKNSRALLGECYRLAEVNPKVCLNLIFEVGKNQWTSCRFNLNKKLQMPDLTNTAALQRGAYCTELKNAQKWWVWVSQADESLSGRALRKNQERVDTVDRELYRFVQEKLLPQEDHVVQTFQRNDANSPDFLLHWHPGFFRRLWETFRQWW